VYRFELPDIGEGVVEAEVVAWKVREGDRVHEDQILVELLTDKAEIEIPSPRAGRVHRLHYQPGDVVPVGAVLLEIDDGASGAAEAPTPAPAPRAAEPAAESPAPAAAPHPPRMPERPHPRPEPRATPRPAAAAAVEAVPAVRELARRLGVDLALVRGTGPRGRIMRRDVEAFQAAGSGAPESAAPASPTAPAAPRAPAGGREPVPPPASDEPDWERQPLRGLRRAIARRMREARRTAAHFTYVEEVDLTALLARARAAGLELSPLSWIANAVVRTLSRSEHRVLNSSIDDAREEIVWKPTVHLGIATATEEGLLVPVIREAGHLSVAELAEAIALRARRAREGELAPGELRGSTFTITSLGRLGGIASTPIVNLPEVAILGVGRIRPVPALEGGELRERQVVNLSLSVDHRIADGLAAARFVLDLKAILERADFPELSGERSSP
jgi:pyruvate dehydrogenase E2 component (dihydrolipoamide acetyltransferase)